MDDQQLLQELKSRFGFTSFRPGQAETIQALLAGKDTLTVLPTGAGKSLLYQLPAHLLDGTVLIVSPLISLMQDQVDRLHQQGERRVIMLSGQLIGQERAVVLRQLASFKFIFTSPEMLTTPAVLTAFGRVKVGLLVVDEAHCISQWGPDFRPEYLLLKNVRQQLSNPCTLMLTATATPRVREDILNKLGINSVKQVVKSVNRPNILLTVDQENNQAEKDAVLLRLVQKFNGPGIVYFASRKMASQMANWLSEHSSLNVAAYHAGIAPIERFRIQQQFMNNELQVICATSAFGMGIDKNDVRFVIHYHLPNNLENYMQEIGRAGRDHQQSIAVLLYAHGDEMIQRQLTSVGIPPVSILQQIKEQQLSAEVLGEQADLFEFYLSHQVEPEKIISIFEQRKKKIEQELQEMLGYINARGCRRNYLLKYFGESPLEPENLCCDNDEPDWEKTLNLPPQEMTEHPSAIEWSKRLQQLLNLSEK